MALVLWPDWPLDFCFRLPVVDSSGGAVELEGMPDAFTLLGTIARGGFGRVEKVKHKKTGQIVARKVFDPMPLLVATSNIGKLKQRFKREVKVQSQLSNDYFISVLEQDLDADPPWFTMPLAKRSYEGKIEEDRAAGAVDTEALADILAALEELHSLGFAHRDLKPTNILYDDERWKLSDFGLVLPVGEETTTLTSVHSGWGSKDYCAPEQAADFHNVTFAADIYSFGCILHDLFSEDDEYRLPYQQATCAGLMGHIIEKCTEVSPKKRFKSVSDLRGLLFNILAKKSPPGVAPSPKAAEWVMHLDRVAEWDAAMLHDLVRGVRKMDDATDRWNVLTAIDEEKMTTLHALDPDLWEELARLYCAWVTDRGFDYEYCDVLIRRLERVFALGGIAVKAVVALAAADLGRGHNRWLVMRRLMALCGKDLDPKVAERIAIEVVAEEAQYDFLRCARAIGRQRDEYHPAIAEVLAAHERGKGTVV